MTESYLLYRLNKEGDTPPSTIGDRISARPHADYEDALNTAKRFTSKHGVAVAIMGIYTIVKPEPVPVKVEHIVEF